MRTSFVEPKTDRPVAAATRQRATYAMARPRDPIRTDDLSEDNSRDDDDDAEVPLVPERTSSHQDYRCLRSTVKTETKKLLEEKPVDDAKKKKGTDRRTQDDNSALVIGFLSLVALLVAGLSVYCVWADRAVEPPAVDETWFREILLGDMRTVRNKFPSQPKDVWLNLFSGIRKVAIDEPTEPTVFLLIHRGGGSGVASCLAREVARVAHRLLNASMPGPLVVDGSRLAVGEDHGSTVDSYRELVEQHRAMVVDNLQSVPAGIARSLHAICDTFTPLVRKAVYVFTLDVRGDAYGGGGSAVGAAERELNQVWGQLEADTLAALVVRVTGGSVLRVEPEERVPDIC